MEKRQRILYLDIIRVVAICFVLMVHTSGYLVKLFEGNGVFTGYEYRVANLFNGISRAAVPLFIMLSGALILDERRPFDTVTFYKKSLLPMVLLFVGWLVAYAAYYAVLLPKEGLTVFVEYILSFKNTDYPHLWYMVFVIELYAAVPILRLFVKDENKKILGKTIVVLLVAAIALDILKFLGLKFGFSAYITQYDITRHMVLILYVLSGWYISRFELPKWISKLLPFATVLFAAAIVLIVQYQYKIWDVGGIRMLTSSEGCALAALYGISLFTLIKNIFGGRTHNSKFLASLSKFSFGVYLIHVAFLDLIVRNLMPYWGAKPCLYILLVYGAVLVLSFLTVFAVSKIKYVRKIFYL